MAGNGEQPSAYQQDGSAINNAWQLVNTLLNRTLLSDSDVDEYLFPNGMLPDSMRHSDKESNQGSDSGSMENDTKTQSPRSMDTNETNHSTEKYSPPPAPLQQVSLHDTMSSVSASFDSADIVIDLSTADNTSPASQSIVSPAAEGLVKVAWMHDEGSAATGEVVSWYEEGDRFTLFPSEPSDNVLTSDSQNDEYNTTSKETSLEEQIRLFISNMTLLARIHFQDEQPDQESQIDILHDELMLRIFSYIPLRDLCLTVTPVCRRWRRLVYDPILWQTLVVGQESVMDPHWLCYLISRARLLKYLVIRGNNIRSAALTVLTTYCPLLTNVNFGFSKLTISMLDILAERCPLINTVNFEGCEGADFQWVKALCQLKKLISININYCTTLSDDCIYYIARNTHNLKSLSIDGISTITDLPIEEISRLHSKTLECINLDGWENTNASIQTLKHCSKLKFLTVTYANRIDEHCFSAIEMLSNLEHLQLRKNNDIISNSAYKDLFKHQTLSNLTYLDLSESQNIRDDTVTQISTRCKKLQTLVLQWCWSVTDLGIDAIVENLWELEKLDLLGIDQIIGHSFDKLPQKLPKLKYLNLSQCNTIDDKLIMTVLNRMPQLEAINFYQENFRHPS